MSDHHPVPFVVLATIGVLVLLTAVVIQIVGVVQGVNHEMPHAVFYVGMVLGFVGFFGLDGRRAKDGGQFIVDSAVKVIGVIRTGRRSTDVKAVVEPPEDGK